ncbi:hypothetical protein [Priestia abyssalis]|uniref:hypothetical protein n=1 Tax=Priestia abyssalis TaxID=1221450 RepID=UPI000995AF66|nr:hypothetical protein [Priestia abyssalis]
MKGYHCKKCNHWFRLKILWLCPVCGNDSIAECKKRKQEEEERVERAWRNIWIKNGFLKQEAR